MNTTPAPVSSLAASGLLEGRRVRKYRLNLVLAHQFLSQLEPSVRDAVLRNVGTIIAFRLGLADAEVLEKEFYPEFSATDLINLPNYHICLKLRVDGVAECAFGCPSCFGQKTSR